MQDDMMGAMRWKLFVDDERDPEFLQLLSAQGEPIDPEGPWITARSQYEAQTLIADQGLPTMMSFDHDFGPEEAGNGHRLAKWLVEQDLDGALDLTHLSYQVHSRNPVGARNIRGVLDQYLKFKRSMVHDE